MRSNLQRLDKQNTVSDRHQIFGSALTHEIPAITENGEWFYIIRRHLTVDRALTQSTVLSSGGVFCHRWATPA